MKIDANKLTSTVDVNYEKINMNELLKIDSSIPQLLNNKNKMDLAKITQAYEQSGATCQTK